jgi:putative hydrolase of the HAD superfamily
MTVAVVVCDLDDTLFPELQFIRGGFEAVGTKLELEGEQLFGCSFNAQDFVKKCWQQHEAGIRGLVFNKVFDTYGCNYDAAQIRFLVEIYHNHTPKLELHSDAQRLFAKNVQFGIITNGRAVIQRRKVKALDLDRVCNQIIYCGEIGFEKPSPVPYQMMMKQFGSSFQGEDFLYVGDHPIKDFRGAKDCGWQTARIVRTDGLHTHVITDPMTDADTIITSLDSIDQYLS